MNIKEEIASVSMTSLDTEREQLLDRIVDAAFTIRELSTRSHIHNREARLVRETANLVELILEGKSTINNK